MTCVPEPSNLGAYSLRLGWGYVKKPPENFLELYREQG